MRIHLPDPQVKIIRYFWQMKILMVCLGNICRSPMAEGILKQLTTDTHPGWTIDSAGTGAWHVGERPDRRAIETCDRNGVNIRDQRARQIRSHDIDEYDLILAMDRSNLEDIHQIAGRSRQTDKIKLITTFGATGYADVPDPYYDGSFDEVFALLDTLCREIIHTLA